MPKVAHDVASNSEEKGLFFKFILICISKNVQSYQLSFTTTQDWHWSVAKLEYKSLS